MSVANRPGAATAAAVALSVVLTGCADKRGGPIPYEVSDFGKPDRIRPVALGEGYRIAPLDTLTVKVFKMPDLSGDYEVDLTGHVAMPLIGSIRAVDLTTAELDDRLTQAYGSRYLENPDIAVGVKASTRQAVTVDGAVSKSGSFPVLGTITLMQAVASAGGLTEQANPRRVAIFRQIDGQRQAAAFDLTSIRQGEAEDPLVYAGDIIIVDGSSNKTLHRQLLNSLPLLNIFRPF